MAWLFKQFSFPGGIPSHVAPETPGSIHEGGELGYSLSHASGAAFDNPDLVVAAIVGDGEAEPGPLATSWHSTKFVDPARDGAVLPLLHLTGYKIANPTVLARIPEEELDLLLRGYGHTPHFVTGDEPESMHQAFAATLDHALDEIQDIQRRARSGELRERPSWPMIVLRSPKGWTGPKEVDGQRIEGYWHSLQVPFADARQIDSHRHILEEWLRSYRPEELFDAAGAPVAEIRELHPVRTRRMSANPHANGGLLLRDLRLPDFREYGVPVPEPGTGSVEATRVLGTFLRDVMAHNGDRFRVFSPDENNSNRLQDILQVTDRAWNAETYDYDDHLAPDGRGMEILSEHTCQGWLEGYLLTGRHGFFSCYEAFVHIVDSMFNQHDKWLKVSRALSWRRPIASLNYLLTSHVWRQDHNGFSHQDPGFVDLVTNKKADIVRVYFPPAANTLLWIADHCLRTYDRINVIVAGKQPAPQWLSMQDAATHCDAGSGIWTWAGTEDADSEPDVVMACAGDVPTLETLAAVDLLRKALLDLKIRVVNVVDLMTLQPSEQHPHGLSDRDFDSLFTRDKPVIFAYHGYPYLIHRLTYNRTNHAGMHVRGFAEEGTTTTPFDMVVLNGLASYHLAIEAIERVPGLATRAAQIKQQFRDKLIEHSRYVREHGEDMPEIRDWVWPNSSGGVTPAEAGDCGRKCPTRCSSSTPVRPASSSACSTSRRPSPSCSARGCSTSTTPGRGSS